MFYQLHLIQILFSGKTTVQLPNSLFKLHTEEIIIKTLTEAVGIYINTICKLYLMKH